MARSIKKTAYVIGYYLHTDEGRIEVGSDEWFEWLESHDAFYVQSTGLEWAQGTYTARKERRHNLYHWYAYTRVAGKLHKRYLAETDSVSHNKVVEMAANIPTGKNIQAGYTHKVKVTS